MSQYEPDPIQEEPSTEVVREREARQWAMFIHLATLAGVITAGMGIILPIVLYVLKKDEYPEIRPHAYEVFNFTISLVLYAIISGILSVIIIGLFGFLLIGIIGLVFPVIAAVKASEGELWRYPLTIRLLK